MARTASRQRRCREDWLTELLEPIKPHRDIARIMLDTGMRPEEVFRIETANLDFVPRTIFNPFGKTAAARRKLTMTDEVGRS